MLDRQTGDEAELDCLMGHRERTGDHRLAGNEGRHCRQYNERQTKHFRCHDEEWTFDRCCSARSIQGQDHRALPEIVAQQRRHHETVPGNPHGFLAEMSHVSEQRFGTGHRQHHGTQRQEGLEPVGYEKLYGIPGIECIKNRRMPDDLDDPERPDNGKIDEHHRREQCADFGRASRLDQEQKHEQG